MTEHPDAADGTDEERGMESKPPEQKPGPPERLWWVATHCDGHPGYPTASAGYAEAARQLNRPVTLYLPATPARLAAEETEAERDRLREALLSIVNFEPVPHMDGNGRIVAADPSIQRAEFAMDAARAALNPRSPEGREDEK